MRPGSDLERRSGGTRSPAASACEPCRETIVNALTLGRNATAIWQDLVCEHCFDSSYESVKRFTRRLRGEPARDAHPTIQTEPGEEVQVGYGTGPMVRDPETGKYQRMEAAREN